MSDELDQVIDERTREIRRCGSLLPPAGFVSSFQTFEAEHPVWEDRDIRSVITDPDRTRRREAFGPSWVLDQKSHGSCNGFAAAGALSIARYLRGIQDKMLLSGAFVYSLINGGRDNGSALEDGLKAIQKHGAPPQSLVPWNQIYPKQQPSNAREEALKHRGLSCWAVQTKQGFRTAVAAGFPVIVAVHAGSRFQRLDSNGIAGVDNGRGNHAVFVKDMAIIGGRECFDMQNSWNTSYGDKGCAWLTWDSFEQTFNVHTFYAIGSTEEAE